MSKEEVKKEQDPKKEPSYELPKTGFFEKGNIRKFAEHYELFDPEPGAAGKPPLKESTKASAKEEEECPGCPKGTDKKAAAKEPEKKPAEKREPIRVLKVNGKDVPVYTQDELDRYAQQGIDYSQKRERDKKWEEDLQTHEDKLANVAAPLMKLVDLLEKGGLPKAKGPEEEEERTDEEIDESLIDPAVKRILDDQKAKIKTLEDRDAQREQERILAMTQRATQSIDETVAEAKKEFAFAEEIKDGEENLVELLFAGLTAVQTNKEAFKKKLDPNFKPKSLPEAIRDSARRMNVVEQYYAKKYGETPKPTLDVIKKENPDLYREIGEDYIAAQKKETGDLPPRIPATKGEVNLKGAPGQKPEGKALTLKQQIAAGLSDPEIQEGLKELDQIKRYGLK